MPAIRELSLMFFAVAVIFAPPIMVLILDHPEWKHVFAVCSEIEWKSPLCHKELERRMQP